MLGLSCRQTRWQTRDQVGITGMVEEAFSEGINTSRFPHLAICLFQPPTTLCKLAYAQSFVLCAPAQAHRSHKQTQLPLPQTPTHRNFRCWISTPALWLELRTATQFAPSPPAPPPPARPQLITQPRRVSAPPPPAPSGVSSLLPFLPSLASGRSAPIAVSPDAKHTPWQQPTPFPPLPQAPSPSP